MIPMHFLGEAGIIWPHLNVCYVMLFTSGVGRTILIREDEVQCAHLRSLVTVQRMFLVITEGFCPDSPFESQQ